jgi:hypothetical protein
MSLSKKAIFVAMSIAALVFIVCSHPAANAQQTGDIYSIYVHAHQRATAITAESNLKQVALAIMMWTSDHKNRYPQLDSSAHVEHQLASYIGGAKEIFIDPVSQLHWTYNKKFSGVSLSRLTTPTSDIIAYSPKAGPDGSRACAFTDGHCKILSQSEWAAVVSGKKGASPYTLDVR